MKRRLVSVLLTAVMLLSLLAGCSNNDPKETSGADKTTQANNSTTQADTTTEEEKGPDYSGVTINFWSMWNSTEPQAQVIKEAAEAFEAKTGAKINIDFKGRDINSIIQASLEAGDAIDMFESSLAKITTNYKDYCLDLTEMAEAADYADKSYSCFNDKCIADVGYLCAITEQPQVGGVFYNRDIFEDCGITKTPTTWEEFMAACQTMVDKGYQPMALDGAYAAFFAGYHFERYLGEARVTELSKNGGWGEEQAAVQAAQDLIDFVEAGYLADGAPDEYPNSENKMGLTGKVAMVVCANYVCSEVNNNTDVELNWGLFNYPIIEGAAGSGDAYAGASSIAIVNYSENAQAAFDFALFLTTGEWDQKMADTAQQIPADPNNTAPSIMTGTVEVLENSVNMLSWNMGLTKNGDLSAMIKEWAIKIFEGAYSTGEEAIAALDSLY